MRCVCAFLALLVVVKLLIQVAVELGVLTVVGDCRRRCACDQCEARKSAK